MGGEFASTWRGIEWSPDGAFVLADIGSSSGGVQRSFRVDGMHEVDLSDDSDLTYAGVTTGAATLSPDGNRLAYIRVTTKGEVVIANADGSDWYVVEDVSVDSWSDLAWAPDGSRLLARWALETNDTEDGFVIIDPIGEQPPVGIPADAPYPSWQRVVD